MVKISPYNPLLEIASPAKSQIPTGNNNCIPGNMNYHPATDIASP